jgi:putative membrane protein (TIGR04086 family)
LGKSTLVWGRPVRRGVLSALCAAILLILISALIFHFTPLSESLLPITSLLILIVSAFLGSFVGAREAGIRGLLHGVIIGTIFFIVVALVSTILSPGSFVFFVLIKKLLACLIAGICGGIVGVSMT